VGRLAILEERFFTFVDLETTQSRAIAACLDISGRVYCNNLLRVQFSKRRGQERISQLAKEAGLKRLQETNQQLDNLSAAMGMVEQQQQQQQQEYSSYYSVEQQRVELPEGVRALTGLTSGARLDDDKIIPRYQCCGYGMLSSRFRFFFSRILDPMSQRFRILIKNLIILTQKCF
jgi:capsid protein